ncbi:MAG: hypothetical protein WBD74_11805, partial [Candidatus Aquilonibacter sp.]
STGAPSSAKTVRASIAFHVPPANKQNARSKPLYISPNTQAFGVFVEPYPSVVPSFGPSSTAPPGLQMFPVATPSPCAAASAGGETCTFTVTAPIGTDLFVVAAFAQPSPNASQGPLSVVVSGPVTVSLSPSPGASPLAFTLNGVVNSVAVTVASPDPGNTPNTQVFTVGVPTGAPITVTAYDSSGNLIMSAPTLAYYNPIVIQASPASDGLTFSLVGTSACGSSASGATATINCAGDLGNVQVTYDGTPRPDASDHLIDAFSVYSTTAPNPTPSPANFVLAGNIVSTTLSTGSYVGSPGWMRRTSSGPFAYVAYLESPVSGYVTGTFDPSTGIAGPQTTVSGLSSPSNFAFLPDGSYWVVDSNLVNCYPSLTATTPAVTGVSLTESYDGGTLSGVSLASDGGGHIWFTGWDSGYLGGGPPAPPGFAGYFTSSACGAPSNTVAQFELTNGYGDGNQFEAPDFLYLGTNSNNAAAVVSASYYLLNDPNNNGVWVMNTTTASGSIAGGQTLNATSYGNAVALDDAQNAFASFSDGPNPADIERMPSATTTLSELLNVPPSTSGSYPSPEPSGLYVFSPGGGAADRAMYIDQDYSALGLVESLATSPLPILVSLPGSIYPLDAAYSTKGGEYVLDMDASENLNIVRILPTKTWWVPNVTLNSGCSSNTLLTVLERGDSGPFTVSIPPASGITAAQLPGADHDFWLSSLGSSSSFTATVTDAHGRTENFNVNSAQSFITCGAKHRPLRRHKP